MEWKDIANVVGKAAPILGTLLGGPAGAAVGGLISTALGVDLTPDAVSAALTQNPDTLLKLKQLQIDHEDNLQSLMVQAEQNRLQADAAQYAAEASDRDSARKLAAQQPTDNTRQIITYALLAGAVCIVVAVFSGAARELLKDATASLTIGTVIGYWFNELKQTLAFWFGQTRDSSNQTKAITQFATAPGTVTIDQVKG